MKVANNTAGLLTPNDPFPVEWVNRHSDAGLLLLCEHAGNAVPIGLDNLGLNMGQLDEHIGWDIGAQRVARQLAALLQAPLILQRFSRLVIDCNRPPGSLGSIPADSDGVTIPANLTLSQRDRQVRESEIFAPLDRAIIDGLEEHPRLAVFSVHSFTPKMQGVVRPWHAGFLTRKSQSTAKKFIRQINTEWPELNLALNEPYIIEDDTDWFIPQHAESRNLVHCLIEIRNDQLQDSSGVTFWAELLSRAIQSIMKDAQ